MSTIENYPALRPTLLLDFANSARVHPLLQCTRASTATCFGPNGVLRTLASNVPRIDYDPETGKCLGLRIEEARTNTGTPLIASGSVPQVPTYTYNADLPPLVAGRVPARNYAVGAVDASSAAGDRANIRGNPSGLAENVTYTASIYVCGVAGGATRATLYFGLAGMPTSQVTIDLVVGRWQRLAATFTLPAGVSGTGALRVAGSGGTDPMQPFGADGYQFEIGAWASSLIPTTDVAVTRAADLLYIDYTLPTVGAIVASVAGLASANTANAYLWSAAPLIGGGADHAYSYLSSGPSRTNWWVNKGGVGQSGGNIAGRSLNVGVSFDATAKAAAIASGSLITRDTFRPRDFPANLSQLRLGCSNVNSGFLGGCISRLAVYSGRVTDAQLQRLTA